MPLHAIGIFVPNSGVSGRTSAARGDLPHGPDKEKQDDSVTRRSLRNRAGELGQGIPFRQCRSGIVQGSVR